MTLLSVPVAEEDFTFLQTWGSKHGTIMESFLAEQAHAPSIHLQQSIHPAVLSATGVIETIRDEKAEHLDHRARKHA